ncbi:MAG: alpha/beta hydrolase [Gammaproteobacteria bacterium]|jgi:acetyl esterase/lipase|nr:alpha/beta hydrolase [Gammaproteobacteria bacterium]
MSKRIENIWLLAKMIFSAIMGRLAAAKYKPITLTYAEHDGRRLELDLYLPDDSNATCNSEPLPLIVWFHGGAWIMGSRKDIESLAIRQIERGFALASVSYSLSDKAKWPTQCLEAKAALRHLRHHAAEYGIDPELFITWGMSAGAHMACMLGASNGFKELEGDYGSSVESSSEVQAVVAWYPPTDFLSVGRDFDGLLDYYAEDSPVTKFLGESIDAAPEKAKFASPLNFVTRDAPPFFLAHGSKDPIVPLAQSELMYKKLKDVGSDVKLVIEPEYTHGDYRFNSGKTALAVEDFLDQVRVDQS